MPANGSIATSAAMGAAAWLSYGAIEYVCFAALPLALDAELAITPEHGPQVFSVLAVYALVGSVSGALIGASLQRRTASGASRLIALRQANLLVLAFALLANLVVLSALEHSRGLTEGSPLFRSEVLSAAVGFTLVAAFALALRSPGFGQRIEPWSAAWVVSALFLSPAYLSKTLVSGLAMPARIAVALGALTVISLAAYGIHRASRGRLATSGTRALAASAVAVVLALAGGRLAASDPPALPAASQTPAPATAPNIVLVTLDTVSAAHIGLLGYERENTPHLRELAKHAVVYPRAYATSDTTLPTHASIFTGLYARSHGAHYEAGAHPAGRPLSADSLTLQEVLGRHGYTTAAVVANYAYLHPRYGATRGFELVNVARPIFVSDPGSPFYLRQGVRYLLDAIGFRGDFDLRMRRAAEVNRDAFAVLEQRSPGRPFFLFLNYMDAHTPYIPPRPYSELFKGRIAGFTHQEYLVIKRRVLAKEKPLDPAIRAHLVSQYDGGIAYLDAQLGSLFTFLRERGLYDDALIVITADHGEAFGERYLMEHGVSVYEDQVHVPLVIKYPGQTMPAVDARLASQVDLLPTILDVAKIASPARLDGRSLRAPATERPVFAESFPANFLAWNRRFHRTQRALVSGDYKLIASTAKGSELYDLATDPREEHDEFGKFTLAEDLEAQLQSWLGAPVSGASPAHTVPPEVGEQLRALGYAD
jgi:arylsulfatase A-like enzyme